MSELYAAGADSYCYPDSSVLRNKFDIRDAQMLADVYAGDLSKMNALLSRIVEPLK